MISQRSILLLWLWLSLVSCLYAQERPNILWITCEDMSPRLGCYGDDTVPTPHIDALAREGVRYTHAFATTGVCSPSRHALITGMYPTSTYALHMRNLSRTSALKEIKDPNTYAYASTRPLYEAVPPAEVRCFTEYLRMAGYYCTNRSKQDYQFRTPVTAWDESSNKAHWRKRAPGQPFFSVFNYTVTHESGIFGKGRSPQVVDPNTVPVPPYYPDTPIVRRDLAKHYDNIIVLDQQVGSLLDELKTDGLLDKTIIFFFSDHGDGLPRAKRWVYDSGTHVPLIVRYPNKTGGGTVCDRLVSFIDFGPSVLSLAGIPVPESIHGKPFLGKQDMFVRGKVYFHRDRMGENRETIRAVRDRRYLYLKHYHPDQPYIKPLAYRDRQAIMQDITRLTKEGKLGPDQWQFSANSKMREELYDTVNDPHQVHNLAAIPCYEVNLRHMRFALEKWIAENNDPLTLSEFELVRKHVYPPDGQQPTTATPSVRIIQGDDGNRMLEVQCETPGASIGYRLKAEGKTPWAIYTGLIEVANPGTYEVKAHRIGYKPSKTVTVK